MAPLNVNGQVRSFEAVCRMVQSGLGIGLLPFQAAKALGKGMNLMVRPLPEPWAERKMLVCIKKDRAADTSLSKLVSHLASVALAAA